MRRCHKCGREWISETKVPGVKEYCEGCSAYLHCCLNCRFYEPAKHNQCAIPTTDWVGDKSGANFCDDFEFKQTGASADAKDSSASARNAFENLFGASDQATPSVDDFKKLFGD
ncbi:MAG: hypothetical protein K1Y02_14565 [Candidatus Hydrogenedentes bacterium]|nr:hypothetical protein [Candidatus Hydrogenedentota bacterium]